jgi:hypothetical protein
MKTAAWIWIANLSILLTFGIKSAVDYQAKRDCVVAGITYHDGEGVPCLHSRCNSCWCDAGKVFSTLKLCASDFPSLFDPPEPPPSWLKRKPSAGVQKMQGSMKRHELRPSPGTND